MKIILTLLFLLVPVCAHASETKLNIETQSGKVHTFNIDIADDEASREQGLMYRKKLADDYGMLFTFKKPDIVYFWMKDTFVALDIIFINQAGVIEKIHPMAKPYDLTQISSDTPIMSALEIKGGIAAKLGLMPGDKVTVKKPSKRVNKTVAKP